MPIFSLDWDNTAVLASPNVSAQRVGYRRKDVGGAWITSGFTPLNDLPKTATNALTPILLNNIVYEFRVQALCNSGGPTLNVNGIQEFLYFGDCFDIIVELSNTDVAATIGLDLSNTNITKVRITLKKTSDNSIVAAPLDVVVVSNSAQRTVTGLTASTSYYWEYAFIAVINGVEIISTDTRPVCVEGFTTNAPAPCVAPGELTISMTP